MFVFVKFNGSVKQMFSVKLWLSAFVYIKHLVLYLQTLKHGADEYSDFTKPKIYRPTHLEHYEVTLSNVNIKKSLL